MKQIQIPGERNVADRIRTIDFHVLKNGEKFKRRKEGVFIKKNDDYAINLRTKKRRYFWPQDTIYLLKATPRNVLYEKYPILEYKRYQ